MYFINVTVYISMQYTQHTRSLFDIELHRIPRRDIKRTWRLAKQECEIKMHSRMADPTTRHKYYWKLVNGLMSSKYIRISTANYETVRGGIKSKVYYLIPRKYSTF